MTTFTLPSAGEVHLHYHHLTQQLPELARFERSLSRGEADRAGRLKSALARNLFIAGRGVLRELLGGYLDLAPADVAIASGTDGKPFLADRAAHLRFNLSHSDETLVIAVAVSAEVGIDIERTDPEKAIHAMSRLVFSPQEQEELLALPLPKQVEAFHRCWVRKEACLKGCGRGFSLPGSSFSIPLGEDTSTLPLIRCNDTAWHVHDLDAPQQYCAALAVENRQPDFPPARPVVITPLFQKT